MREISIGNRELHLPLRFKFKLPWWPVLIGPLGVGWAVFYGPNCFGWLMVVLFAFLSVMGIIHLVVCRRYLELGEEALLVPAGFLHRRFVQIPYATIEWVEHNDRLLIIRAHKTKADLGKMFLRKEDYDTIRAFLVLIGAINVEQLRQEILAHPGIDRRQDNHPLSDKASDVAPVTLFQLPDRAAFIAFWKEEETFRWRKLLPIFYYVGGLGFFAYLTRCYDPTGQFWLFSLAIAIAYVFLAPTLTWRHQRKKYARFIRCFRCGDWFASDLSGAYPTQGSNPKLEIITQTGHCVNCGTQILTDDQISNSGL